MAAWLSECDHRVMLTSSRSSWAQAHTHERVAERSARRRKDESPELRSAVSSSLISSLVSYSSLRRILRGHTIRSRVILISLDLIVWSFVVWLHHTKAKRCMWVYALHDSTRGLCLATKIFSPKRPHRGYSHVWIYYIPVLTHLIVGAFLSWGETLIFGGKSFLGKSSFLGKIIFIKKEIF